MIAAIFDGIPANKRTERGFAGEYYARHMFAQAGYTVERQKRRKSGDLLVTDEANREVKIEVKTAKKRPDGKFAFQLRVGCKTDCKYSDYVCLVAVHGDGVVSVFLIPVRVLGSRNTITLPNNLNLSKWSDYRVKGAVRL
jgi:hypothetical protein